MQQLLEQVVKRGQGRSGTQAFRLFHGRGHCYEGLEFINVDFLAGTLFITLYEPRDEAWLAELTQCLLSDLPDCLRDRLAGILLQHRYQRPVQHEVLWGEPNTEPVVMEGDIKYQLQIGSNQNTGLFLDMAEGRRWVRDHAKGRRILNLFAYTCAFSVAAVAGGADEVINLDMARGALNLGRTNHQLNNMDKNKARFFCHDLFRSWGKLQRLGPYDLVIIDPPSFQRGSFELQRHYPKIINRLKNLVASGGDVLACLNDPDTPASWLSNLMQDACPEWSEPVRIKNSVDFPEYDLDRCLKVLHMRAPE